MKRYKEKDELKEQLLSAGFNKWLLDCVSGGASLCPCLTGGGKRTAIFYIWVYD